VALGSGEIVERRIADGSELRRWRWGDDVAKCVAYGDEGRLVAAAMGGPGRVLGPGLTSVALASSRVLRRAGRLADGRVWALDYAHSALIVDPKTAETLAQATGPGPFDGSSSPDGETAAILDTRGGVWLLRGSSWGEVGRAPDAVALDVGDGGSPIVIARRREVCVDARCVGVEEDVIDVALSRDHVAVATLSGDVSLLDVRTNERSALLRGHDGRVSSVEFGPDGRWLVSGRWDGTARLWDLEGLDEPAEAVIARAERTWGIQLDAAMRGR
jgi:hypothetical protein